MLSASMEILALLPVAVAVALVPVVRSGVLFGGHS